jgi:uncharacterized protein (DUF2147 family)
MKSKISAPATVAAVTMALTAQLALGAPIDPPVVGVWHAHARDANIQISLCGEALCGKILSASRPKSNPQLLDVHNKDPALRDRSMIGQVFFQGFMGGPTKWTGGRLYNPGDGNTYSGTITMIDNDHLQLKGCAFWFLCDSQILTRIEQ